MIGEVFLEGLGNLSRRGEGEKGKDREETVVGTRGVFLEEGGDGGHGVGGSVHHVGIERRVMCCRWIWDNGWQVKEGRRGQL